jgi:carbamoyl-phosphate synthase small subunit
MNRWNWKTQREKRAFLALEDGAIFRGYSIGADQDAPGEVVFNTGMTGYQEILSDPSYAGQFVTLTHPEIGNTGLNEEDQESDRFRASGLLIRDLTSASNWRATSELTNRLRAEGIPALAGLDTRALTIRLREKGTMKGFLSVTGAVSEPEAVERARAWSGLDNQDYASRVTCRQPYEWDPDGRRTCTWGFADSLPPADRRVVVLDYGVKWSILRHLRLCGLAVTVVPAQTRADDILARRPAGVVLSNGPADPAALVFAIKTIRALLGRVPIFGICLGHQLLGLAMGGRTRRLKFGHHAINHPVMELASRRIEITSQNHNFIVDPDTLGPDVEITHINLNDQTVEGLRVLSAPAFAVQYHPEAGPGPHDAHPLFRRFRALMDRASWDEIVRAPSPA